jgi:hypothetical protein
LAADDPTRIGVPRSIATRDPSHRGIFTAEGPFTIRGWSQDSLSVFSALSLPALTEEGCGKSSP